MRFGQGYPRKENQDRIGSRTDIWITGYLRQNFSRFFEDSLKLHNRCRIHMDRPAKAPAVTKNALATDSPVNTSRIDDKDRPINAAYK